MPDQSQRAAEKALTAQKRRRGIEAVLHGATAREIALMEGCSTDRIYNHYGSFISGRRRAAKEGHLILWTARMLNWLNGKD